MSPLAAVSGEQYWQAMAEHLAVGDAKAEEIDPAHLPGVLEGLEQARRGEFATDEDVEKLFRHFGK